MPRRVRRDTRRWLQQPYRLLHRILKIAVSDALTNSAVAAAAVDYVDHYTANFGPLNNPGRVFVNMLLMGDRTGQTSKHTFLFDNLYGAGRLKARRFDAAGMDAPARWATGNVCVHRDEVISIPVNGGNPLASAVDTFEVVAWWYDRRHELGVPIDNVDLEVAYLNLGIELGSGHAGDEKRRYFSSSVAGDTLEIRLIGDEINSDLASCGLNGMLVYWAYFFEDSARDDADGPNVSIEAE
jgi:hypothetical protein